MADPLTIAAAAGGIAKTIGSIFAGSGAKKRAKAIQGAAGAGKQRVSDFTQQFLRESGELKKSKLGTLSESANIFDRFGGFIFGDTDSLASLRDAQEDFSALAAGDTSGFLQETESIVKSALAGTFGSPRGAFENLSARNLLNFRSQGLQNALSLTNNLGTLGSGLINTEFGIFDQDFNNRLRLREQEVAQLNALDLTAAGVEGTSQAATGNVFNTLGQGAFGFGNALFNRDRLNAFGIPGLINQQQASNQSPIPGAGRAVPQFEDIFIPPQSPLGGTNTPVSFGGGVGLPSGNTGFSTNALLPGNQIIDVIGGLPVAPITVQPLGFNPGEFASIE